MTFETVGLRSNVEQEEHAQFFLELKKIEERPSVELKTLKEKVV